MIALVAGSAAKTEADGSLAREPRDTLTWSGAPVVAAAPLRGRLARTRCGPAGRWCARRRWRAGSSPARPVGAVRDRAQAVRPAPRRLPGHPAEPGSPGRAYRGGGHGGPAGLPHRGAHRRGRRRVVRDRGGQGAHRRGGEPGGRHRAPGARRHRLHLRARSHFVTRRLWSWRAEFGAENHWSVALGRQVAARGAESLWPHMTSR